MNLENEVFGPQDTYYRIQLGATSPVLFNTHKYLQREGIYTSEVPVEFSGDSEIVAVEVRFESPSSMPRNIELINENDESTIFSWTVPSGAHRVSAPVSIPIAAGLPFSVRFSGGPSSWNSAIVNLLFKVEV